MDLFYEMALMYVCTKLLENLKKSFECVCEKPGDGVSKILIMNFCTRTTIGIGTSKHFSTQGWHVLFWSEAAVTKFH